MKDEEKKFSFRKGYEQVPVGKAKEAQGKIMKFLGIKGRSNWSNRLRGIVEPKWSEKEGIEKIFKSYGIKKVWRDDK